MSKVGEKLYKTLRNYTCYEEGERFYFNLTNSSLSNFSNLSINSNTTSNEYNKKGKNICR